MLVLDGSFSGLFARLLELVSTTDQLDDKVEEVAKETACLDLAVEVLQRIVRLIGRR